MADLVWPYAYNNNGDLVYPKDTSYYDGPFFTMFEGYKIDLSIVKGSVKRWHFRRTSDNCPDGFWIKRDNSETQAHIDGKLFFYERKYFYSCNLLFQPSKVVLCDLDKNYRDYLPRGFKLRPDLLYLDANNKVICAIEIFVTNKKKLEDARHYQENRIVAFQAKYNNKGLQYIEPISYREELFGIRARFQRITEIKFNISKEIARFGNYEVELRRIEKEILRYNQQLDKITNEGESTNVATLSNFKPSYKPTWDIEAIRAQLSTIKKPKQPMKLGPGVTIQNPDLFIDTHLQTLETNNGNPTFEPFFERLQTFINLCSKK
jgi:hypothetical protein